MNIPEIQPGIRYVGVNDRTTTRFEALWPLPAGVSYNAYLVVGERIALVDTVEERFGGRLFENIRREIGDRKIDYLVINHMEPDHAGSVTTLAEKFPGMTLVGNAKTFPMLSAFTGKAFEGQTLTVKDGDALELGAHTLVFCTAPMVHWPEVMVSYEKASKTLFSADGFGRFGAGPAEKGGGAGHQGHLPPPWPGAGGRGRRPGVGEVRRLEPLRARGAGRAGGLCLHPRPHRPGGAGAGGAAPG